MLYSKDNSINNSINNNINNNNNHNNIFGLPIQGISRKDHLFQLVGILVLNRNIVEILSV